MMWQYIETASAASAFLQNCTTWNSRICTEMPSCPVPTARTHTCPQGRSPYCVFFDRNTTSRMDIAFYIFYVKSYSRYKNKEKVKKVKYNRSTQYNAEHNTSQNMNTTQSQTRVYTHVGRWTLSWNRLDATENRAQLRRRKVTIVTNIVTWYSLSLTPTSSVRNWASSL